MSLIMFSMVCGILGSGDEREVKFEQNLGIFKSEMKKLSQNTETGGRRVITALAPSLTPPG